MVSLSIDASLRPIPAIAHLLQVEHGAKSSFPIPGCFRAIHGFATGGAYSLQASRLRVESARLVASVSNSQSLECPLDARTGEAGQFRRHCCGSRDPGESVPR